MPTLNYNPVPSVATSPSVGGNYLNVQATPGQFGAQQGQALENLGHVFEQAGSRLADVAIQRQGIFNRVAADEAMNNWQDATNKLLYGDPNVPGDTGFYGKKGREAMDAFPVVRKQLDDTLQQHRQGLQNPMQQLLFDQESRRIRSFLMSETGRHYDQENNRWTQSVYHGKSELAKQDVARAVANGDVAKMNESIGQWSSAIMKSALTAGHSEEEAKALVGKMVADVVEMQADKLSADDPRAAMQFIQDHRDQFKDPEKFLHLQQRVKAAALKKEAQDIANGVPAGGQSLVRGGALNEVGTGVGHVAPKSERIAFAREYAESKGLNPDAIIATMAGEGLNVYTGDNGTSFGDLQLHVGGGMGDQALKAGINIRDPNTWKEQIKFGIDQMAANRDKGAAWYAGQWHGAPAWAASSFATPGAKGEPSVAVTDTPLVKVGDKPQDQLILPPTEPGEYADNEVPGLMGELQRIMKDPRIVNAPAAIKSDLFNAAVKEARTKYNTAWTAQQRDRQLQRQQQQDTDRALIREYQSRMTSDSPNYPTIDEVRKDTRLSESAVKDLTGEIMRDTKPETDSKTSARNQRLLSIRMDPDYQGEDKITTEKQIREAYNMGQLTRSDRNELIKDFEEQQDPTSPRWRRKIEQVLKGVEVKIVPQIAFMPRQQVYSLDDTAAVRVQNWRQAAEAKIAEYVAAGKNPNELFIPGTKDKPNPEYIGGDQFLSPWVGKLNNKLEDKKPATGAAVKSINEMTTLQELQAAAAANPMLRDAARARALELGLVRPATPSIEVPMAR